MCVLSVLLATAGLPRSSVRVSTISTNYLHASARVLVFYFCDHPGCEMFKEQKKIGHDWYSLVVAGTCWHLLAGTRFLCLVYIKKFV